ncbi:hypothetical protein [Paenibacillus lautus]
MAERQLPLFRKARLTRHSTKRHCQALTTQHAQAALPDFRRATRPSRIAGLWTRHKTKRIARLSPRHKTKRIARL